MDHVAIAVVEAKGKLTDPQFELGQGTRRAFQQLHRAIADDGQNWGSCELTIDQPGTYRFNFSYEPPARLHGIWDEQRAERLDNYLTHYLADMAK